MLLDSALNNSERVIVEFGMGDGLLLKKLVENNYDIKLIPNATRATYVGIEVDEEQFKFAKSRMRYNKNVFLLNAPLERIVPIFANCSIDQILYVLPDPEHIDRPIQRKWESFYKVSYLKLKGRGLFRLVTEVINDLLEPVSDEAYNNWIVWLSESFETMGFTKIDTIHSSPDGYITKYLTQFRGDTERIRIVTMDFIKVR